ncbi:MAG: hypothetical protein IT385_17820 [Deltaproteobacteria bacterium]|nr:hypothetical protein [Deltaproteobacteria bacterium]
MDTRPSAPKVLGILSIIFGSLLVLLTLFALLTTDSMLNKLFEGFPGKGFKEYMDELGPWMTIWSVITLVMAGSLLAIGIGQLRYRRWARASSIVWALAALVFVAGQVAFHFLVTAPALERLLGALAKSEIASMIGGLGSSSIITTVVLYSPYPIITLVLMRKPEVVEAMNT